METLAENNLVSKSTLRSVKNSGLTLDITKAKGVLNPRRDGVATWVGVDTQTPTNHLHSVTGLRVGSCKTSADLADNYFDWLGANEADYLWSPVHFNEKTGCYSASLDKQALLNTNSKGLMLIRRAYFDKQSAWALGFYKSCGDYDSLESYMDDQATDFFNKELGFYNAWLKGDAYNITIGTIDNQITQTAEGIFNVDNSVEDYTIRTKNNITSIIDGMEGMMHIALRFDNEALQPCAAEHLWVQDELNKRFGANIIVGSCTVGYSDLELNMSILKDSIPPFKELADKENVNLFDLVRQNLSALEQSKEKVKIYRKLDAWTVGKTLMSDAPYSEWPEILMEALLYSLFESIEYVHIASVNINSNEPKPDVEAVA